MSSYDPRSETGYPDDDALLRAIAQTRDDLNRGVDELKGCLSRRDPISPARAPVTATSAAPAVEYQAVEASAAKPEVDEDVRPRRPAYTVPPTVPRLPRPPAPPPEEEPRADPASMRPEDTLRRLDALAQRLDQRLKAAPAPAPAGAPPSEAKD